MTIIITNSNDSISLTKVTAYIISKQINYSNYDIPSKSTPTVDTDAFSVKPTTYRITAKITNTQKNTLIRMRDDNDLAYTLVESDNVLLEFNVRLESMEFSANPGFTTVDPWNVTISFTAVDH